MKALAIALIRLYQSRMRGFHNRVCIYEPSCSEYAIEAIRRFGVVRGVRVAHLRIRRCNGAVFEGGYDPVS